MARTATRRAAALLALAFVAACGGSGATPAEGTADESLPGADNDWVAERIAASPSAQMIVDARRPAVTCPAHGDVLREALVPLGYGLAYIDSPQYDSVACPYVGEVANGGCIFSLDDPQRALVKYCPQCRAERPKLAAAARDAHGELRPGGDGPRPLAIDESMPRLAPSDVPLPPESPADAPR